LFFAAADIVVGDIGFLLDLHHGDGRINFRRKWNLDLVLLTIDTIMIMILMYERKFQSLRNKTYNMILLPDTHSFFNIGRGDLVSKSNNKLGNLLDIDDVLGLFILSALNDFGTTSDL
jgi:hypothetical protein